MFCQRSAPHSPCRLNFQCSSDQEKEVEVIDQHILTCTAVGSTQCRCSPEWTESVPALPQSKHSPHHHSPWSKQSSQPWQRPPVQHGVNNQQNSQPLQQPPVYHGVNKQTKRSTMAMTTNLSRSQQANKTVKQTEQSTMAVTTYLSWSQANKMVNRSSDHLSRSQQANKKVNHGSDHLFTMESTCKHNSQPQQLPPIMESMNQQNGQPWQWPPVYHRVNQLMNERDWKPYAHFHIEPNSQFSLLSVQQKRSTNPF